MIEEAIKLYVLIGMGVTALALLFARRKHFEDLQEVPWWAPAFIIGIMILFWPRALRTLLDMIARGHRR
jgi:hypothetical protein